MNKTAICTINYGTKEYTLSLLKSLDSLQGDFEVFLLENGSKSGYIKKQDLPNTRYKIHFYTSDTNKGFAGGNNILLKQAAKIGGFNYFWLLNNDAVVCKDSLSTLLGTFSKYPKAGVVGSLVIQDEDKVWWAGSELNLTKGKIKKLYYGLNISTVPKTIFKTDEVNGAVMCFSKDVYKSIGNMDTEFFHTAEDTDYSLRAKKAGFELYINPKSKVYHGVSKSSGGAYSYKHMYYVERGRILLMKKYGAFSFNSFLSLLPFWVKRALAPFIKELNIKASIYTFIGIIDGIRNVKGKKFN